jgi:hypothetical protein
MANPNRGRRYQYQATTVKPGTWLQQITAICATCCDCCTADYCYSNCYNNYYSAFHATTSTDCFEKPAFHAITSTTVNEPVFTTNASCTITLVIIIIIVIVIVGTKLDWLGIVVTTQCHQLFSLTGIARKPVPCDPAIDQEQPGRQHGITTWPIPGKLRNTNKRCSTSPTTSNDIDNTKQ